MPVTSRPRPGGAAKLGLGMSAMSISREAMNECRRAVDSRDRKKNTAYLKQMSKVWDAIEIIKEEV